MEFKLLKKTCNWTSFFWFKKNNRLNLHRYKKIDNYFGFMYMVMLDLFISFNNYKIISKIEYNYLMHYFINYPLIKNIYDYNMVNNINNNINNNVGNDGKEIDTTIIKKVLIFILKYYNKLYEDELLYNKSKNLLILFMSI